MAFNFSLRDISLASMAVNFFYASACIGVLAIAGLYWFQGSLIYMANYPDGSRQKMIKPNAYNLPYEDIVITTPDGIRIGAYLIKRETDEQTSKAPTLIYFHANAGNMGHRIPISEVIHRVCHCNILMLSYRGYGYSEGTPTEKGLKIDAQAALDFVLKHPLLKDNPIVVYGQSLGGAVAVHIAATNQSKVKAIILENTFLSIPKLLPNVFPTLKYFTKLCHQIWDSESAIASIESIPTLFISGLKDELIPPAQMKKLHDTMPNHTSKVWKEIPDGNHNDTCTKPGYFQAIEAFFVEYVHKN